MVHQFVIVKMVIMKILVLFVNNVNILVKTVLIVQQTVYHAKVQILDKKIVLVLMGL